MGEPPIKIDAKDRKILYQLDLNCRQSLGQIAKKVGLSKQVVDYRIKRLEESGIVKGYYTIMDISRLGFYVFKLYLKFRNPNPQIVDEIVNYFVKDRDVTWVVTCDGEWDLNVAFLVKRFVDFYKVYHEFLYKYGNYVREKDFAMPVEAFQFRRAYVLGNKTDDSKYDVMNSPITPKFEGDKTDWEILKLIAPNAKMELQEMSDRLKISPKTVSNRIKNMVKIGIIQSFRALFDVPSLGYAYYKIFVGWRNMSEQKEREIFTWLRMNPNIVYITKSISNADYEFEMQAKNRDEFYEILRAFMDRFKENISYVESLHYYKEHKFLYIPEVTPL